MQFDDLVFTPPDDLDAVATVVMARGRRRRQVRRTRTGFVAASASAVAALTAMALMTSPTGPTPVASGPAHPGDDVAVPTALPPSELGATTDPPAAPSSPISSGTPPTTRASGAPGAPVAASPSRDVVAFVSAGQSQLNDIFLYDAARGTTTALTNDPSGDSWPTWSPYGTRIAFHSDREGAAAIYVMAVDGSSQRRITDFDAGYQAMQPAWSPRGDVIAFTVSRRPVANASVTELEESAIWLIAPDGSGARQVLEDAAQPAWSPDGVQLAFVAEDELRIADLNTGHVRTVVTGFVNVPAWSPDGERITYQQSSGGRDQIYLVNADGTDPHKAFESEAFDYSPSFSPDGTRLVFRHDPDGPERVYCENFDPAPSGCRGPGTARGQLWVVDIDTGHGSPLIDGRLANDFLPRFAPRQAAQQR